MQPRGVSKSVNARTTLLSIDPMAFLAVAAHQSVDARWCNQGQVIGSNVVVCADNSPDLVLRAKRVVSDATRKKMSEAARARSAAKKATSVK